MPASVKSYLAKNKINFYIIDAVGIARDLGLGNRTNMIMQSAFFKLANVIPMEQAEAEMKNAINKDYGNKGEARVKMNYDAVDKGVSALVKIDIPDTWARAVDPKESTKEVPEFIANVLKPMGRLEGDKLPVSTFQGKEGGSFPVGTSRYEKRGVAAFVPHWIKENCIQCARCAVVCSHSRGAGNIQLPCRTPGCCISDKRR